MEKFGFGREVGTLTISLFVGGYCVGPLLWGPLSDKFGRRIPLLATFTGYVGWTVGCALSRNTASILIFRFLGGMFAASGLVVTGYVLS
jgi:MFS family permease